MTRGNTAANFPQQTIYTFAAAAKVLGRHPTTLFRQAKEGKLRTVNTPVGRRIHRDEIRRQSGEISELAHQALSDPNVQTTIGVGR